MIVKARLVRILCSTKRDPFTGQVWLLHRLLLSATRDPDTAARSGTVTLRYKDLRTFHLDIIGAEKVSCDWWRQQSSPLIGPGGPAADQPGGPHQRGQPHQLLPLLLQPRAVQVSCDWWSGSACWAVVGQGAGGRVAAVQARAGVPLLGGGQQRRLETVQGKADTTVLNTVCPNLY